MLSWKDAESQVVPPKHVKEGQNVKMRMKQQKSLSECMSLCFFPHVVSSIHPVHFHANNETTNPNIRSTHTISQSILCLFLYCQFGKVFCLWAKIDRENAS